MDKRKLFFAIGVIAVILLGSTFFALNQRGKEEKKEKKRKRERERKERREKEKKEKKSNSSDKYE